MAGEDHTGGARFMGLYTGCVTKNDDPKGMGRVRVIVPAINGQVEMDWAMPIGTVGGGAFAHGIFAVPPVGAMVAVFPDAGDETALFYIAGWWPAPGGITQVPTHPGDDFGKELERVVWETPAWRMTLSHKDNEEFFRIQSKTDPDLFMLFEKLTGKMTLSTGAGKDVLVGDSAATQLAVLGNLFMTFFNAHTHLSGVLLDSLAAPVTGTTGPPVLPMTAAQLSSKVKIAT